jgi:4-carboxymuconolactone decarboxylase
MTARPPRMPPLADSALTDAQKAAIQAIVSGPRGRLVGPFIPLLRSPEFMLRLQHTGAYLRFDSALEPRRSEMVILMTARLWTQAFEWHHHRPIAEKAGLNPDIIDAIAEGRRPAKMAPDEEVIYDFIDELSRNRSVCDATYARAIEQFGERGVIDMIGIHGYYSLLAMVLNVSRAPLPEGATPGIAPLP